MDIKVNEKDLVILKKYIEKSSRKESEILEKMVAEGIRNLKLNEGSKLKKVLTANKYKGSGKCWIANIDKNKNITTFADPIHTEKIGTYKQEKTYELPDGNYQYCKEGSKSQDDKGYFKVENGEEIKIF